MTKIIVTREARADLKRIWHYIASDNESAADRVLIGLKKRFQQLEVFPESGSPHHEIRLGCRMLVFGSYNILYAYHSDEDTAEIIAVIEGVRDASQLLH